MAVVAAVEEAVGEHGPYPRKKGDASLFVEVNRGNGQGIKGTLPFSEGSKKGKRPLFPIFVSSFLCDQSLAESK